MWDMACVEVCVIELKSVDWLQFWKETLIGAR